MFGLIKVLDLFEEKDIVQRERKPKEVGKEENFKHVINWLSAFVYYYNRIKGHMSLNSKTPFNYYQQVLN